jgi:hypothetical protein
MIVNLPDEYHTTNVNNDNSKKSNESILEDKFVMKNCITISEEYTTHYDSGH